MEGENLSDRESCFPGLPGDGEHEAPAEGLAHAALHQYLLNVVKGQERSEQGACRLCCSGRVGSTAGSEERQLVRHRRRTWLCPWTKCALEGPRIWGLLSGLGSGFLGFSGALSHLSSCPECRKNTSYTPGVSPSAFLQNTLMHSALFHSSVTLLCWPAG